MNASKERLYQHVEFLTTLRPFRNYLNLESLERVCDYLKGELAQYGLEPAEQKYVVRGTDYKNITASYQPQKERRLIVGAHYDVCGDQPGADDNASAVAGLLETGRMTAEAKPDIGYGIDFVAYCLEEPPFYATNEMGSYVHAESIHENKEKIIGLINFEMIGYFHDGGQEYPDERLRAIYPEKADFIVVVGRQEYHQMSDDIDTLDFDSMREVVTATWKAVTGF